MMIPVSVLDCNSGIWGGGDRRDGGVGVAGVAAVVGERQK